MDVLIAGGEPDRTTSAGVLLDTSLGVVLVNSQIRLSRQLIKQTTLSLILLK